MSQPRHAPLHLRLEVETWPLKAPFHITGHTMTAADVIVVTLEQDGLVGRGEACGVYYFDDDVAAMVDRIEAVRPMVEAGIGREALQELLPAGGARNALDCALWDLDAKRLGVPAWRLAGLDSPGAVTTAHTVGANPPDEMAAGARAYRDAKLIKLKLTGEPADADRVRAVRDARPDVFLIVDANQGFTPQSLLGLLPTLTQARVSLIEQPFPVGAEALLDDLDLPIPIGADESAQTARDVARLAGRFDVINIKLDKSGGLTEALAMAREAQRHGLDLMVGNMTGTSLAMAPAFLIAQLCRVVDLDGPMFLQSDRRPAAIYRDGTIWCPESLWGGTVADVDTRG
jgi:L-alanine-DL-glutamate epimerase-like enolase superfamily enzyme